MDSDLEAIRAKRLAQLQGGGGDGPPGDAQAQNQQKQSQEDESRRTMLQQILDSDARERLNRIALVRPERARAIEQLLVNMARGRQLKARINETQLIQLLDQVEAAEKGRSDNADSGSSKKIVFNRRNDFDDDDSDF